MDNQEKKKSASYWQLKQSKSTLDKADFSVQATNRNSFDFSNVKKN